MAISDEPGLIDGHVLIGLLDNLKALEAVYTDEPVLRETWAVGITNSFIAVQHATRRGVSICWRL